MGIILIALIGFIVCYLINKKIKTNFTYEFICQCLMIFFAMAMLVCSIGIGINHLTTQETIIKYQQDKIKIEIAINNSQITGEERASILDLITKCNTEILSNRYYGSIFVLKEFYPKSIQNLELFDINKIPKAKIKININN